MTRTVRPEEEVLAMKPEYVAPLVGALCSEKPPASGQLYEAGTGYVDRQFSTNTETCVD